MQTCYKTTTVEPPVSDHPKCQALVVVAYESLDHIGSDFSHIGIRQLHTLTLGLKCFVPINVFGKNVVHVHVLPFRNFHILHNPGK